jgi:hypothetical protein
LAKSSALANCQGKLTEIEDDPVPCPVFWLTKAQLKRIEPFFPRTRGIPRVDSDLLICPTGNQLACQRTCQY